MTKSRNSASLSSIKALDKDALRVLASDIRADILSACLSNGGHLSSNLGAVELTISLVKNFDLKEDDILFDVGHQAYSYKILTGRNIRDIRITNGISPFNLREESPYDVYSNGHAGDCISTATGITKAKVLNSDESFTIAVVGDASIENGLSFEALDYLAAHKELKRLIVLLNDNGMAISKNRGPIAKRFTHLRNSRFYFRTSSKLGKAMAKHKLTWKMFLKLREMKDRLKTMVISPTIFESMGIKYIGPFDGHDFPSLDLALEKAKLLSQKGPVLVHVLTKKGYGYPEAMKDSSGSFHGVSKNFDQADMIKDQDSFSSIKESLLYGPMERDQKHILITPAMEKGSSLERLFSDFPERCIDTGIAEEHAVVLASGLALEGYHPIVDIYSTFLQRCYDEIMENVSRNKVKVTFLIERAGLVGEDGSSHHGIYDVGMVKNIPYRKVYMPYNKSSICYIQEKALSDNYGPFFIRFPKGKPIMEDKEEHFDDILFLRRTKQKKLVLAISVYGYKLLSKLNEEFDTAMMLNLLPDDQILKDLHLEEYEEIYLYDPYSTKDGSATFLGDYLLRNHYQGKYRYFAFKNEFVPFGQNEDLLKICKMDVDYVYQQLVKSK